MHFVLFKEWVVLHTTYWLAKSLVTYSQIFKKAAWSSEILFWRTEIKIHINYSYLSFTSFIKISHKLSNCNLKDLKLPGIFWDIHFLNYVYTMLNYGQLVETKDHWQPWLPYLFMFMNTWETITQGTVIQYLPMCLQLWYTLFCELRGGKGKFLLP